MADNPPEVPLHQYMQHEQQTRVGSHRATRKLGPRCHYWNLVWQIPWLECGYQWLQAVQKGQARKEGWRCCPLYQEMDRLWRAASEGWPWAGRKLMGKNQRLRQQRELCGWCLLQATWSKGDCWWSLFTPGTEGITLAGSCSAGGLQPPGNLLEK